MKRLLLPFSALASGEGSSAASHRPTTGSGRGGVRRFVDAVLRLRLRGLLALTFVLGLVAAVDAGLWMQREIEHEARANVAIRGEDLADQLESRFRAYGDVLYAIRGFMDHAGAAEIHREEFRRFVDGLAVAERYPGLDNMSFAYRVPHAGRREFERKMQAEFNAVLPQLQPFAITPDGDRAEYQVLSYVEPLAGNSIAIGMDLASDPLRNDALRRARDSGGLATSAGLKLRRDRDAPIISVLLRLAVYDGAGVPRTLESRRQTFAGVAGIAIRLPQMLEAALPDEQRKQWRVVINDVTEQERAPGEVASSGGMLFDSASGSRADIGGTVAYAKYRVVRRINVGDRNWELCFSPLHDPLESAADRLQPYATAAAILLITLLLCGLLRSLATAKAQSVALRGNVQTLEFHRRRLAETQEIAKIGGWEWDMRRPGQVWSDRLYRLLGRAVGDPPEPTDEFFINRIVHPADIALARGALKQVVQSGGPVEIECRVLLPDGSERIVSSLTRLEAADDGARTRVVGTVRDITDDHRAAARERAQLVFIQTMMDAIPTPVFQKDPAGRFRACNDAWCQFLGRPREEIIGHTLEEFMPGSHDESVGEKDSMLLARPATSVVETTIPNAAGEPRQLMLHKASYLADDGTIAGLVGVVFDITDRMVSEQHLQRTIAELDRRNAVARLLSEFSEVLQSCVAVDEAYETVAKYLPRLLPGSAGVLYRVDPGYRRGERVAGWGDPTAATSVLAADDCVAVRRSRPRNVADAGKELNCRHFVAEPPGAYACLPLSAQGDLIGLLHVEQADAEHAEATDMDIGWTALTTAAEHIGLALANLALRETLREQATHDKLTGLYNRHYLNARFEQELARVKRSQQPLAIVMLDIDHFKRFNDNFGHAAGDHVLRELAQLLRRHGRESDVACRYGGEEFVLFLPEVSAGVAFERAEQIRKAVKALPLEWEGQALSTLTVSAGVAAYPEHGDNPEALLRFADRALYRAKDLGRDRVVLAPGVGIPTAAPGAARTLPGE